MERLSRLEVDQYARIAARLRYATGGTPLSNKQLQVELNKILAERNPSPAIPAFTPHRASELVSRALREELVELRVHDRFPPRAVRSDRERAIALAEALYKDNPGPVPYIEVTRPIPRDEMDDARHAYVGVTAAERIGPDLGRGDRLVVSAGRAVSSCMRTLATRFAPQLAQVHRLYALTGGIDGAAGLEAGTFRDADSIVNMVVRILSSEYPTFKHRRTLLPAAALTSDETKMLVKRFAKFLTDWHPDHAEGRLRTPDRLIAGVGLIQHSTGLASGNNPYLQDQSPRVVDDGTHQRLDTLERYESGYGLRFGEVGHHIFACTTSGAKPEQLPERVSQAIANINGVTIGPTLENLNAVKRLSLIAAGRKKASVIKYLLSADSPVTPTQVFIDAEICDTILEAAWPTA